MVYFASFVVSTEEFRVNQRISKPAVRVVVVLALSAMLLAPCAACAEAEATVPRSAYLFSYFIGNREDGLRLVWSRDGYNWEALKDGASFLKPQVGESKLMRDPCQEIVQHADAQQAERQQI
jgi:hypothetical protein